jgi:denticleless
MRAYLFCVYAHTNTMPRPALATRTNTLHAFVRPQQKLISFLSTPLDQKPKRRLEAEDHQPRSKRLRVEECSDSESEETEGEFEYPDEEDAFMENVSVAHARARISTPFNLLTRQIMSASVHPRVHFRMSSHIHAFFCLTVFVPASTLPILQSFVSSNKSDVFRCHSIGDDNYMTPPYACSYSHSKFSSGHMPYVLT